ncbi:hypothetical protein HPO96_15005 [Kribbella sandramycini]|uniref:DUF8094 domain-containing protein n=1 Tax=Kribbella sandramycini TaxID=60450 RepID=A0A7Y4P052_9ACTN|nr:hypothetical protein [Kribbella sandramycini]MBB6565284.1 hypothetical protein [Kribbella sandramycini]NOL41553.1 hypothetical protein [Kribbella sandramycini]
MRFARTVLGLLLTLIGLLATVAGAAAAFWLIGPDNTISTGDRGLSSSGLAVVTAPELIDRHGPVLHVDAAGAKPLFVGIAQDLDVTDYLAGSATTRVIRYDAPSTISTQTMRGLQNKLTPPGELDWWVAKSGGAGARSIAWPMQDGRYSVVVMNADGTPAVDADVRFGIEIHRSFGISLLIFGAGLAALTLGITLAFRRTPQAAQEPTATPVPTRAVLTSPFAPTPQPETPSASSSARTVSEAKTPMRAAPEDVPAYRAPVDEPPAVDLTAEVTPSPAAPADRVPADAAAVRPLASPIPAAPMFMSAAAVARAKSRAALTAPAADVPEARPGADVPGADVPAGGEAPVPLRESPEFVKSDEAVKRTAALLASGALLLTTTSCGLMPPKNSLSTVDHRPAITLADAQAVVAKYNELNNKANQSRDDKLAATIESEPTLAQTRAGYQIGRKLDAARKVTEKPFAFTDPQVGAPEFTAYPMRFVVTSGVSGAPDTRQLGVWERDSAGAPWLLTHSVYPGSTIDLPSMTGLRAPTKADLASLATQPSAVGATLAAYLTGGAKSAQSKLFIPSPGTTKLLELRAKAKVSDVAEPYIAGATDTFKSTGRQTAFITADGEALVFLSLTEQYLQRVEPGSNAYWTSGEATAFSSMVKYTQTLHQDYLHQVALIIPAKSTGGPIRILSMDGQLVGAGGT